MTTTPPLTSMGDSVSVVIPTFNRDCYVLEAVRSSLAQGPAVREVIVVDDGSTDDTRAVLTQISDSRLRVLTQQNQGPSAARNAGWRSSCAPWLMFLDADDTLAPTAVAQLLAAARSVGRQVIPFGHQEVYARVFRGAPVFEAHLSQTGGNLLVHIALSYRATIFCGLFPRRCVEAAGGFDEAVAYGEDYDFAMRVAKQFDFVRVPVPVYRARMHDQNRHRLLPPTAIEDCLRSIDKVFANERSVTARLLRRRARAHWLWKMGQSYQTSRQSRDARVAFRRAWLEWPLRVGTLWRSWVA